MDMTSVAALDAREGWTIGARIGGAFSIGVWVGA